MGNLGGNLDELAPFGVILRHEKKREWDRFQSSQIFHIMCLPFAIRGVDVWCRPMGKIWLEIWVSWPRLASSCDTGKNGMGQNSVVPNFSHDICLPFVASEIFVLL
jgi:hypothetical protein